MTTTVRSPKYPEIVEQALGTFLDKAPLNIQEYFQYKKLSVISWDVSNQKFLSPMNDI